MNPIIIPIDGDIVTFEVTEETAAVITKSVLLQSAYHRRNPKNPLRLPQRLANKIAKAITAESSDPAAWAARQVRVRTQTDVARRLAVETPGADALSLAQRFYGRKLEDGSKIKATDLTMAVWRDAWVLTGHGGRHAGCDMCDWFATGNGVDNILPTCGMDPVLLRILNHECVLAGILPAYPFGRDEDEF